MKDDLRSAVSTFVTNLTRTVERTIPQVGGSPFRTLSDARGRHITVRQQPAEGFSLCVDGQPLLTLKISFRCVLSSEGAFLTVAESDFAVLFTGLTEPLLRYHYVRDQRSGLPTAHLHVHAHRDEVVTAMLGGPDRGRVRARLERIGDGRFPRLAALHMPLGGPRFRPGVEDVLQMLHSEFEIDVLPTFNEAISEGRSLYRELQLMAAVQSDPLTAASELERLGYSFASPPSAPARPVTRF